MVKAIILQTIQPPEEAYQGLAWVGTEIWLASAKAKQIFRGRIGAANDYQTAGQFKSPVKSPGGMAWDGKEFLIADRIDRVIFNVNPESGIANPVLDLADLEYGDAPALFQTRGSQPTDIAWGQGHLWLTCQAGYSSSIFRIDLKTGRVVQHFKARGPKPEGISFDVRDEYFWTVDSRNQEFSQFTSGGEWTEQTVPTPVAKPSGLALDDQGAFWTTDQETKQVYQIKGED